MEFQSVMGIQCEVSEKSSYKTIESSLTKGMAILPLDPIVIRKQWESLLFIQKESKNYNNTYIIKTLSITERVAQLQPM